MPRRRDNRAPASDPLRETRARIREAEKKQNSVIRVQVGMSAESFEAVAVLVERGVGKAADVQRQALETGLRVMMTASTPQDETHGLGALEFIPPRPFATNGEPTAHRVQPETTDLVSSTLGVGAEIGRPITEPEPTPEVEA